MLVLASRKLGVSESSTVNITWIVSLSVLGFDLKSLLIFNDTRERKVIRLILRSTLYFVHHVGVTFKLATEFVKTFSMYHYVAV